MVFILARITHLKVATTAGTWAAVRAANIINAMAGETFIGSVAGLAIGSLFSADFTNTMEIGNTILITCAACFADFHGSTY